MKKALFCLVPLVALAACNPLPKEEIPTEEVRKIATAPDGTVLWGVYLGKSKTVYFASSGTSTRVGCGKNCTRAEEVPTANPGN